MFGGVSNVSDQYKLWSLGLNGRARGLDFLVHELSIITREAVESEVICHVVEHNRSEAASADVIGRLLELGNRWFDSVCKKCGGGRAHYGYRMRSNA